ncbi:RHTO0S09e06700g1_1 [Rhodotorula toruloides]|uniref:RHTO0S09e06700g1_1 n=1 Tax=Rhodotorula toruloides TaxID=5286 RepID=A0A061B3V5_RHOTO|nr:RHTO0S09e06700g1_1 [Rhodotorula toruloides]
MWIESGFLSQASSYFKTLLSSDFAETAAVTTKYSEMRLTPSTSSVSQDRLALTASGTKRFIRKTGALISHSSMSRAKEHATISDLRTAASEADFDYFDDSDDETDELYFAHYPPQQHRLDVLQLAYKEIKVTKTAFTTYRAVLACLRTGYITFASLWSTFFYSTSEQAQSRRSYIEATVGRAPPTHPYPVSPKSAFRLAHLLELEPLQHLCLANLKAQLTIKCAPYELFSEVSVCYDTWRKVVLDFVVDNWDAVTGSAEWDKIRGELERDEIEGATSIMLELMRRVGKAV